MHYSANNNNVQIKVDGWKTIQNTNPYVYYDGTNVEVVINKSVTASANAETVAANIPSNYAPEVNISNFHHNTSTGRVTLLTNGNIIINGGPANPSIRTMWHYRKP